jgi:hypothetical protein
MSIFHWPYNLPSFPFFHYWSAYRNSLYFRRNRFRFLRNLLLVLLVHFQVVNGLSANHNIFAVFTLPNTGFLKFQVLVRFACIQSVGHDWCWGRWTLLRFEIANSLLCTPLLLPLFIKFLRLIYYPLEMTLNHTFMTCEQLVCRGQISLSDPTHVICLLKDCLRRIMSLLKCVVDRALGYLLGVMLFELLDLLQLNSCQLLSL